MGAWGPGIFEDDLTSDMQSTFEDELEIGDGVAHATVVILREYSEALEEVNERPKVWLALATLQLDHHLLQQHIRHAALEVIDSGVDQRRWDEEATPEDAAERKKVLEELRARLLAS